MCRDCFFANTFTLRRMVVIALCAIASIDPVWGSDADREGNIVEYFGKEKIEEIREGELAHVFQRGLMLARPAAFGIVQSNSTPVDEVMGRFLFGTPTGVDSDRVFDVDYRGEPIKWEEIEVDETGTFENRQLRSGVLYLRYETDEDITVLLDASGHTSMLIDGMPHEGDHYDFGWQLIPLRLQAGEHDFVLQGGRFGKMRARLVKPTSEIAFTRRDMTLPDIRREDQEELWGAIRVINASRQRLDKVTIECEGLGQVTTTDLPRLIPHSVRKVPFRIPAIEVTDEAKEVEFELRIVRAEGQPLATETITLDVRSKRAHHKRTFRSEIDGSIQYYSVAPATNDDLENPAMFLSVHGASVEAVNQAAAYEQKDWGHLVAPTNRRPFGFAWEDWGRLDALEVLQDAEAIYATDRSRTYLTGHSMGGHGTWYLGATYPDRWAAIAPCAGYPDLLGYRDSFLSRIDQLPEQMRRQFGMTEAVIKRMRLLNESKSVFDEIVERGGNPSRTLKLINNYSQFGVYVLHGEKDTVVPTAIARMMRQRLGEFHSDFTYYEYPNGSHWYGNHSVDWEPIFDFFKARSIKPANELEKFSFSTASPGVSASSHFVTLTQQEAPLQVSSVDFLRAEESLTFTTANVEALSIDLEEVAKSESQGIVVDGQTVEAAAEVLHLLREGKEWVEQDEPPPLSEKGPHRNGGFKDAFRNRFVLVYGTKGTEVEDAWYLNRARCDGEKFWYRANGNVEIVADVDFVAAAETTYADRNIVIYGNRDNNSAWEQLLRECPLQVSGGKLSLGDIHLSGPGWGAYFVYPRSGSERATVGVVTATGVEGMKAAYANHYLVNATCFPDVMIFDQHFLERGVRSLKCAGFWSNRWEGEGWRIRVALSGDGELVAC